ncbi:unnamed protein product [Medioppia subpectinata]|uniref:ubiquitinyl hydrolase 1 n=1 Tax=Medioppia subpectinata TaxID=1979941 RepID=A0A7R9PT54_9ACAR|nr:unnamed protein product [Medioppia subpectinata]CAG2100305.1 unnamed protein product [Medioppia subpectinata]
MTILPKKKQNNKTSSEDTVDTESLNYANPLNPFGHNSRGHSPQTTSRWTPINGLNQRNEDKRSANDSDGTSLDSGPTHSKRRLRRDDNIRHHLRKGKALANSVAAVDGVVDGDVQTDGKDRCGDNSAMNAVTNESAMSGETASGYNSGDEYEKPSQMWSKEEWDEKERVFAKRLKKKAFVIKQMGEDGACLFRAVADQIYGDQEMHESVRKLCMDYMVRITITLYSLYMAVLNDYYAKNGDYFSQYVTEDFTAYIERKRLNHIHGNHIEMQAMSEIFNRPIEVYHYSCEPINIFQGNESATDNEPIRLSYHKNIHYNSIVNPQKATIGLGLGLPAFKPGFAEKSLMEKALHISEQQQLEQAMLEDKIRATDWEATNEAIEEQIARESYVEWLKENEMRSHKMKKSASATSTATGTTGTTVSTGGTTGGVEGSKSPNCQSSPRSSPKASGSGTNERDVHHIPNREFGLKETASFMHELPPQVFGLKDWTEDDIIAKVLAQSQEEYIESLKRDSKAAQTNTGCKTPPPSSSTSSNS